MDRPVEPGATTSGDVPDGFEDPRIGGFVGHVGPIFRRVDGNRSLAGFLVESRHCNPSGICHGGWLSTFADVQLVRQTFSDLGRDITARTISLTVDFLSAAQVGDWVEGRAEVISTTRTMAFVQGAAHVGDRPILRMSGIFSLKRSTLD